MFVFLSILLSTYLIAVNVYSLFTVLAQKNSVSEHDESPKRFPDSKLYIAGLLGGAVTVYTTMIVTRFKTNNLPLMLTLPILSALDIYLIVLLFTKSFFLPL